MAKTDFAEAHWIGCSYVITRVDKAKSVDTNSFWLRGADEEDKRFEDEPITFVAIAQQGGVPAPAQAAVPQAEVPEKVSAANPPAPSRHHLIGETR